MIIGAYILFCSKDPEADRAFSRDVLGFRSVDVGEGWLIFARTTIPLPSGGAIGLYQPRHKTAFKRKAK